MLNHITIMGRLTRDPQLRTTGDTQVCNFRIACERNFKDKDGERGADFIDVVAWRKLADHVAKHFKKGRVVIVDGRLQIRDWTDREGGKRRSAEVVADNVYFGESKKSREGGQASGGQPSGGRSGGSYGGGYDAPPIQPDFHEDDEDDADLPF